MYSSSILEQPASAVLRAGKYLLRCVSYGWYPQLGHVLHVYSLHFRSF